MSKICNEEWDKMRAGERMVTCSHFIADLVLVLEYFDFDVTIIEAMEAVLDTRYYSKFNDYLKKHTADVESPLRYVINEVCNENETYSDAKSC